MFFFLVIGCGFQTKQRYRFGWFSMKLKLVGGDSAGVVTAYYVSLDLFIRCFEFLFRDKILQKINYCNIKIILKYI